MKSIAWQALANRIVQGLGVQPGELIYIRDHAGRFEALKEILLAVELAGATPLPQIDPADYMERLWTDAPIDYLAHWDRHRRVWTEQADRILVLDGADPEMSTVPPASINAWRTATQRLTEIEEQRRLPFLLAAIPTEKYAQQLGLTLADLDSHVLSALGASVAELRQHIRHALNVLNGAHRLTIRTGDAYELVLVHGDRQWLSDDGYIDDQDRQVGAIVTNLPAGSIYTTVVETDTQGSLWLPKAGAATDVVLRFDNGRIITTDAASGADQLAAWLDSFTGEPRRVAHIGLGLNPHLHRPIGWTFVDEHVYGSLFISLGENRYMGGQNSSSLNVDFAIQNATLLVDDRVIVTEGNVRHYH